MLLPYRPTSSILVEHIMNMSSYFNSYIDTPCMYTQRTGTFSLNDNTYADGSFNKWNFNVTFTEDCTMKKSTILYMDTIRNIYIWKYEEQDVAFTIDKFSIQRPTPEIDYAHPSGGTYPNVSEGCIGRQMFWVHYPDGRGTTGTPSWLYPYWWKKPEVQPHINCKETIYAIYPGLSNKVELIPNVEYTKDPFYGLHPIVFNLNDPTNVWFNESYYNIYDISVNPNGGDDFYYPYWVAKHMLSNPVWQHAADTRVETARYYPNYVNTSTAWEPTLKLAEDSTQIGSIVFDTMEEFIASLVINTHNSAGSETRKILNFDSIGNVLNMVKYNGYSNAEVLYPIGLV